MKGVCVSNIAILCGIIAMSICYWSSLGREKYSSQERTDEDGGKECRPQTRIAIEYAGMGLDGLMGPIGLMR